MPVRIDFFVIAENRGALLPFTGAYVRGFFLAAIKCVNPQLFNSFHDHPKPRPYAIRPLRPVENKMRTISGYWVIEKNDKLTFSISILQDDEGDKILEILENIKVIKFGAINCRVYNRKILETKYKEFSGATSSHIGLIFRTPTFFNIRGRIFPFLYPDPVRIFSNLSTIWNTFAPKGCKININKFIDWTKKNIMVKSYRLITREIKIKGIKLTGFRGKIEWIILDEGMLNTVNKLLHFAEFSNVGEKRTYGLGVVDYTQLDIKSSKNSKLEHHRKRTR